MKISQILFLICCCVIGPLEADVVYLTTVEPFKEGGKMKIPALSSLGSFIEKREGVQRSEYKNKDEIVVKKHFIIVSRLVLGEKKREVFQFGEDDEKAWRFHLVDGDVIEICETQFLRFKQFSSEKNLKHTPLFFKKPQEKTKSEPSK